MTLDHTALQSAPRLLLEATLRPLQGKRFQPTGFADLGAARFTVPNDKNSDLSVEMLLVESAQSVANRLEAAVWNEPETSYIATLNGLPFVKIDCGELGVTASPKEFHRLNSPYIWSGKDNPSAVAFREAFCREAGVKLPKKKGQQKVEAAGGENETSGVLDFKKFYKTVFKYDPNAVIHGLFLEKVAGRLRMTRLLSGFIEASDVTPAENGGTKIDNILPSPKVLGLDAKGGYGNVPFHRTEFVAKEIKAYFNFDLALMRSYGFDNDANSLLISLALLKIVLFLESGLRLRSACDLEVVGGLKCGRPSDFVVPEKKDLLTDCTQRIQALTTKSVFAHPAVTEVKWELEGKSRKTEIPGLSANTGEPTIPGDLKKLVKWTKPTKKKPVATVSISPDCTKTNEELSEILFPDDASAREALLAALVSAEGDQEDSDDTENGETPDEDQA